MYNVHDLARHFTNKVTMKWGNSQIKQFNRRLPHINIFKFFNKERAKTMLSEDNTIIQFKYVYVFTIISKFISEVV